MSESIASFAPAAVVRARPRSPRVRRAMLTWSAGAIYTIVTVAVGLFTTPLLIKFLGADRLGASRAAVDWMGYLVLADFGVGAAINVLLLRAHGQKDEAAKISIVKFALRLFIAFSALSIGAGMMLAWKMPALIHGVPPGMSRELQIAALITAGGLLLTPFNVLRGLLETEQRGYLIHLSLLVHSLTVTSLAVLLAWRGWGLIGQSLALVIGSAVFAMLMILLAFRGRKNFASQPRGKIPARQLWKLSWPLGLSSLGVRLNVMTDSIVTGFILGPSMVTTLFVTQRLVQLCGAQINALANSSWAALAELRAAGEHEVFSNRVCELARLIVGAGITLTGTLAAYNGHFVRLWVGQSNYGGDLLSAMAAMVSVLVGFSLLFNWIIDSHGDTRLRLPVSIAGAVINLSLSIFLARKIGLPGVLIGTALAEILTNTWYGPRIVIQKYRVQSRALLIAVARGVLCGGAWVVIVWLIAHAHTPPARWIGLIGELIFVALLTLTYCWLVLLSDVERARWRARLRAR